MHVTRSSEPIEKIHLFRSLFRGREDVYPLRFESQRTGRSGYSPACANEWVPGVCEKPRVKCAACPHQKFFGVSDEAVRHHLTGRDDTGRPFVMGVYPMLLDETCFFLAVDLDGGKWREDALGLKTTCESLNIPVALEKSRSGDGGHLWIFFSEPVPASSARKLGTFLLTKAMDQWPDLGFDSYDRLFPNQDTLPKGGFGNLIALPLQGLPRQLGNSVFLNDRLEPVPDQWGFLSSLRKMTRVEVEAHVTRAAESGSLLGVRTVPRDEDKQTPYALAPWSAPSSQHPQPVLPGPHPQTLEIVLGNQLYIPKENLPPILRNRLLRIAAFQNPEFYKAQAMRLPVYNIPRIIACAKDFPNHIALPRGTLDELKSLLRRSKIRFAIQDERFAGTTIHLTFQGTLRADQQKASTDLLAHDTGVLCATTAFGKTVLAAHLIASRGVNTLILVHRKQLMDQWKARLTEFLNLEPMQIGCLGGGRRKLKGQVDIAMLPSIARKSEVDPRIADYGHVIIDECHHVSARNFELAVRHAKAKFITGLTATAIRKDGLHPIIFMQCGPIRHRVEARDHANTLEIKRHVMVRPTGFLPSQTLSENLRTAFGELLEQLALDDTRNRMICDDVQAAVISGSSPIVLTERTGHLETLAEELKRRGLHVAIFQGGMTREQTRTSMTALQQVRNDQATVLLATGKFVGEGFDHAPLDALFLTLPISWRGTVIQYAGRLHRAHQGKQQVRIFDYADLNVPMLARMFNRRCKTYEKLGYSILMPASALPGWPPNVPLPLDTRWKQTYAASARRLVRDGVEEPLARLFVETTSLNDVSGKNDIARARSAAEAFLFSRLQSLEPTRDLFQLNVRLPIPFRGYPHMEVDFVCPSRKLVIELDGPLHFTGPDAYRRDRKKDYLLQENGYTVLRFLAEDPGKDLNTVMDTLLRALAHCGRKHTR